MPDMRVNTSYHTRVRNIVLELQAGAGGGTVKRAETAQRLETPRKITLHGDVNGSAMFDGGNDLYIRTFINRIDDGEIDNIVDYEPANRRIAEHEIDGIIDGSINLDSNDAQPGEEDVRISEQEIDNIMNE